MTPCRITYSPTGRGRPCGTTGIWWRPELVRGHGTLQARRRHHAHDEPLCGPCETAPATPRGYRPCGCPWPPLASIEQTLGLSCGYAWDPTTGWVHQ